jgi:hypothetical protein
MASLRNFEPKRALVKINMELRSHGCAKLATCGDTLQDPVITRLESITPGSTRTHAKFRVLIPCNPLRSVFEHHDVAEFDLFFDRAGRIPDGAIVKAMEAGQFLLREGTVWNIDEGWLIEWEPK